MCYGASVEETEEEQTIQSFEGFAALDGGATKNVSGFTSVQQVVNQNDDTTIETTGGGFTFADGETEAASTIIWMPHTEFPPRISVNVVSNESTVFSSVWM